MQNINEYKVTGMHCASCSSIIEDTVKKMPGVKTCLVNFVTETAQIEFDKTVTELQKINSSIKDFGYKIESRNTAQKDNAQQEHPMYNEATTDLRFLLPMVFVSFFMIAWEVFESKVIFGFEVLKMPPVAYEFFHHLMPIFASFVLFGIGRKYIKAAILFFKTGVGGMDTLVGISSVVAFLYSFIVTAFDAQVTSLIGKPPVLYDVVIITISLIAFGQNLENVAKKKTNEALHSLANLGAKRAAVEQNGVITDIDIAQIAIGNIMVVKPGEIIPTDGQIIIGTTTVNEAMITGESVPTEKKAGDFVIGGTINLHGFIKVQAIKVGNQTMLARIIKLVQEAQNSKAPIQKIADTVSHYFIYIVLAVAVMTLILWLSVGTQYIGFGRALAFAITCFVGVLAVACPCSLGLATPTALITGVGRGAQNGILIKNAAALEQLANVNCIVFDKTGTLTEGSPKVITQYTENKKGAWENLYSLLRQSAHPLASAVEQFCNEAKLTTHRVEDFKSVTGMGVVGVVGGNKYFAGNKKFIEQNTGLQLPDQSASLATKIYFANTKELLLIVELTDKIKTAAKQAIQKLVDLNIYTVLATGDNAEVANAVAAELGINQVVAGVTPSGKVDIIKNLEKKGFKVAMVGDGVNDAPALATANVSIAMATGSESAIEAADVTLLHGDIGRVTQAIHLSRSTMRIIKQNLFWSFGYNAIGIPLAAGLFYPTFGILLTPAVAGAIMAFESLSVVLNSLRIKNVKL